MPQSLLLYKASAGSGKTFRLAVEYIKLLLLHPNNYCHILAVTFTNKATSEMKARILSQLYGIAHSLKSSDSYLHAIQQELQQSDSSRTQNIVGNERQLRRRAQQVLDLILDDYNHFRVETIDSYFTTLLREVARELMLPNDFRTEIGIEEPLHKAVQDLFDSLPRNRQLFDSVVRVLQARVDHQQDWQIRKELELFGKQLFNERFLDKPREEREKTGQVAGMDAYRDFLNEKEKEAHLQCRKAAELFFSRCQRAGIGVDDLMGGSRQSPFLFFDKLRNPRKACEPSESILTKNQWDRMEIDAQGGTKKWLKNDQKSIRGREDWVKRQLIPLQRQAVEGVQKIYTLQALRNNLDALAFVDLINQHVQQLNEQEHRFLLSDTAHLINDLIDNDDIPFIYERTGERFQHLMIDEFQDTSALQWENFIPLIYNALAKGNECLIVGDVKQSIYRWRNSDWNILNNLERQSLFREHVRILEQPCNFRSAEVVVNFNNSLFERAAEVLERDIFERTGRQIKDISNAYAGARQTCREEEEGRGYVRVDIVTTEQGAAQSATDMEQERTADALRQLFRMNVPPNHIAILTRTNKQIDQLIRYLSPLFPTTSFVSNDAYRLDASPAVLILIQALRVVSDPDNDAQRTALASLWQQARTGGLPSEDTHNLLSAKKEQLDHLLPPDFTAHIYELPMHPLYDLCEEIINLFQLNKLPGQDAYLIAFLDHLAQQLAQHSCAIDELIALWERNLREEKVPMGEIEGVKLLTIHKAKGLEFHSVIVPFAEWGMGESKGDILWCDTPADLQGPPEARLPLAPIAFANKLAHSQFNKEYTEELIRKYVDHLNLLYVAFTRAAQNLFIIARSPAQAPHLPAANDLIKNYAGERGTLERYMRSAQAQALQVERNPLLWPTTPLNLPMKTYPCEVRIKQSQRSKDWRQQDSPREEKQRRGILIHELLSRLHTLDDLSGVLKKAQTEGLIEQTRPMAMTLRKYLKQEEAKTWFEPRWQVINEGTILTRTPQGGTQAWRPDRVVCDKEQTIVIDFKTGQPRREHETQVINYMQCLRDMGYPNVEGRIWYTDTQSVVKVKSKK